MTDEQLIQCIQQELDKDRTENIPGICFRYLRFVANDYGKEGLVAKQLLEIAANLIGD